MTGRDSRRRCSFCLHAPAKDPPLRVAEGRSPGTNVLTAFATRCGRHRLRVLRAGQGSASDPIVQQLAYGEQMTTLDRVQVLFLQGGGEGAHDEWDAMLVDSLAGALGDSYEVRFPRLPREDEPSYLRWGPAITREIAVLDDGAVLVGHSVGAAVLMGVLAEPMPQWRPGAIILLAAPFVGPGGWPSEEFKLPGDLGRRLPRGTPVDVFHGMDDQAVPPSHADLYARAIPQARVHRLVARDHQFNQDLSDIAPVVRDTHHRPNV